MGISVYMIKKWADILAGRSIFTVKQGVGNCYSKTEVAGYYNDLTEKVTKDDPNILVPKYYVDSGDRIEFSIGIFQYGLASYDMYLTQKEEKYRNKVLACADWAVENQQKNGGWKTFVYKTPEHPYSSMAQGEGVSLLIRAHCVTQNDKYLDAAHRAMSFMLRPISDGGTTFYVGEDVYFYEYTHSPLVLNGWIFSLWGVYDYCKYTQDEQTKKILEATLCSLKKKLPEYHLKYWSKYDDGVRIASPFYHDLHISLLMTMHDLFGDDIYKEYAEKWQAYQNSFWKCKWALITKGVQKIREK